MSGLWCFLVLERSSQKTSCNLSCESQVASMQSSLVVAGKAVLVVVNARVTFHGCDDAGAPRSTSDPFVLLPVA